MSAGELEVMKAMEDVSVRNAKTTIAFAEETRKLARQTEEKFKALQAQVIAQEALLNQFRIQLASIQTKVFSGGTD